MTPSISAIPDKAMFGSEDTNDKTTRGEYVDDRTNGLAQLL